MFWDLLAGIGSVLSSIASFISSLFVFLFQVLQAVFVFLWNGIVAVVQFFGNLALNVGRFFARMWRDYLKPGLRGLINLVAKLREILARYLGPVLRWLRKLRDLLDKWYFRIFGPILRTIQQIRGVLKIFRLFGLEFARKLDEKLAGIESKITAAFLAVRDVLTQITGTINLVLDPGLLIRKSSLAASILQMFGTLTRFLGWGKDSPLSIADEKRQKTDREFFDQSTPARIAQRHADADWNAHLTMLRAEIRRDVERYTGAPMHPTAS